MVVAVVVVIVENRSSYKLFISASIELVKDKSSSVVYSTVIMPSSMPFSSAVLATVVGVAEQAVIISQ